MIRLSLAALVLSSAAAFAAPQPKAQNPAPAQVPVAVAAVTAAPNPALPQKLRLRPEISLSRDLVTFGDLIPGLPADSATTAAFRAPNLGETGTIQVARIVEAARAAGIVREVSELESHGFAQVVVTRAARRITAADLEAAVKAGLQDRFGVDARLFALAIDGGAPAIAVEPELTGDVGVLDLSFDARSRRLQARLAVPGSTTMRLKPLRISGQLVETVEVVVPKRAIARGETLTQEDVSLERRPRDGQGTEILSDVRSAIDKVARRALLAGSPLRSSDIQREEIVAKGDLVTIIYESKGLVITLRGRANEAGAMGDVISVTNPQSKRVVQGRVSGQGRINVQPSSAGRIASAN